MCECNEVVADSSDLGKYSGAARSEVLVADDADVRYDRSDEFRDSGDAGGARGCSVGVDVLDGSAGNVNASKTVVSEFSVYSGSENSSLGTDSSGVSVYVE